MSNLMQQLAAERRRRYEALSEAEKPKVAVCSDCGEATYKHAVCPASGLFHDMDKKKLVGGSIVDGNIIKSSELMNAIDRTRVKWAPSRTQLVKADAQSLNIFQSFAHQMDWNLQRYGILYGRYDETSKTIEVHSIYEPEQHGTAYSFEIVEDKRIGVVDRIATELGLRRVGAVCTHPPRDPDVCLLTAREMLLCAREQSRFGDECVLLTVAPRVVSDAETSPPSNQDYAPASGNGTGPGQQMVVECQAWQTSPQCVYLYRIGALHEPSESEVQPVQVAAAAQAPTAATTGGGGGGHVSGRVGMSASVHKPSPSPLPASSPAPPTSTEPASVLREPETARYVASTMALEVTQQDTDSSGKQRFVTQAPAKLVDTRWFTSYIAVQQFESDVVRGLFMRISRPGMAPPTFQNLRNYFNDPKRKTQSFAEKIADFHVLIFLAETFGNVDDLTVLVQIAKSRMMTEEARNYESIVKEYMS